MEQRLAQFSSDYKFGFLGEAYIEDEKLEFNLHQAPEILKKYFSLKKPYYCNRNSSYYSTELVTVFEYIEICPKDLNKILTFNINQKTKQYILFSIMNHLISNISKLVGVVFSNCYCSPSLSMPCSVSMPKPAHLLCRLADLERPWKPRPKYLR